MEYMIIFSMTFFMSLLLLAVFTTQTNNVRTDLANAQMDKASSEIIDAAREVYFMGEPAQKTIRVSFPAGVQQVIVGNTTVKVFVQTAETVYQIERDAQIQLSGSISSFEGLHTIVVKAQGGVVSIEDR